MTTLLAFIVTLALLIVVHEYGHYRVAVACGVKVLRFSVGFGRVIWRRQLGETEFALSALPLGGYVKMLDTREGEVIAAERSRAFDQRPLWQRSAIVVAGPLANLLLAVLLYAGAHWVGVDEPKALLGSPLQGSMALRSGFVAGDWVQSTAQGDEEPVPVRSMNDFRWRLTEAAETVHLGENCRAMLLNLKMRPGVELKSVSLETLSQEVVVGLMGITVMN